MPRCTCGDIVKCANAADFYIVADGIEYGAIITHIPSRHMDYDDLWVINTSGRPCYEFEHVMNVRIYDNHDDRDDPCGHTVIEHDNTPMWEKILRHMRIISDGDSIRIGRAPVIVKDSHDTRTVLRKRKAMD